MLLRNCSEIYRDQQKAAENNQKMEEADIINKDATEVLSRKDIRRAHTSDDDHDTAHAFNNNNNHTMLKNVGMPHIERMKLRDTHISDRRCRSLETNHDSRVKRTRNSPTKLMQQCRSFDSEHDKLRDKQLSSMKCENVLQNKDSRRKSDDYKHGVFKFRSSVDTTQLYSIKNRGLSDSSEVLQSGEKSTSSSAKKHNIARQSNSLSNIVSSVKRYEKIILSRKGNVQSLESDEFEVAENDDGNLMEQLLQLKMSSETKKSMEHVSNSGEDATEATIGSFFTSLQRTTSIDSNCSLFSLGLSQKAESISDLSTTICKCDDCLLGITDALADLVLWNSSNSIQYSSIDENAEVEQKSAGKGPQGQLKTNDQLLKRKVSGWRKVRNMVQWTPFVQTFKNKKYQWVQLAGHSGNFKAGKCQGTVLKKLCAQEEHCYKQFNLNNGDPIKEYVPGYQGIITLEDDEKFIQLQDCLSSFNLPSIMDCKIGVRTYLEEELAKAKEKPKLRNDMYNKMVAVDSSAPTEEETRLKGVTKPRYMVWRETISSTATLGFRLEGIKKSDGSSSKDFKTTKTKEQVSDAFRNFTSSKCDTVRQYLDRLKEIKIALEQSEFFRTHELIGSSLLFVHDTTKANVWLIDFGKTVPAPNGITIDHKSPWEVGNHEDGYLIGVQNLINIFSDLAVELNTATPTPENHLKTRNSPHHDSRSAILKDDLTNSNVRIDSAKHDMSGPSVMSIESKEDAPIIKNISDSGEVRNNS